MERQNSSPLHQVRGNNNSANQSSNDNNRNTEMTSANIHKKWSMTIEPLLFVIFFSEGLSGTIVTNFVIEKSCEVHFQFNSSVCNNLKATNKSEKEIEELIQPYASIILTGMNLLSVFLPSIMSLFLGSWSDKNGRKLLLIIPAFGYFLKYGLLAIFSLVSQFPPVFAIITVIPVAFSGGFVNLISAAFAYVCDISSTNTRFLRISILEVILGFGSVFGNLMGPLIFNAGKGFGYTVIFGLSSTLVFLITVFSYYYISESVQVTERNEGISNMFDIKFLKEIFTTCFRRKNNFNKTVVFLVIVSLTMTICVMDGESNVKFLFTRLKFDWDIQKYSEWISATSAIDLLGLFLGSIILKKYFKISDSVLGVIANSMVAASALFIAFIPSSSSQLMYYVGLIKLFGGLSSPAGRSLISKNVPEEDLGKVFALTTTSESVFPIAISPLYTLLYNSTIESLPSAFFFLSTSFYIVSILFYLIIYFNQKMNANKVKYDRVENNEYEGNLNSSEQT